MIKLSNGGAYLINGTEVIEDGNEELLKSKLGSKYLSKEEAGKNTIAYGILKDHNTSGSMDKLQIKFDKLTSHDITFVGIIQTNGTDGNWITQKLCKVKLDKGAYNIKLEDVLVGIKVKYMQFKKLKRK